MYILSIILSILFVLILIRLLFRFIIDFPAYRGKRFADGSGIENLMPEDRFWQIIKDSKKYSKGKYELQCELLTDYLEQLPADEIIRFNRTFYLLLAKSYSFRLWQPAYSLNGGCSDDCFEYFRTWLIGQGHNKFYWSVKYPRLLFFVAVKEMMQNYEGLAYCALHAHENKTGKFPPELEDIHHNDPGKIFNENEAFFRYPELALLAW